MRAHKKSVDPNGILNPRKVFGNGLIQPMVTAVGLLDPLIRLAGNLVPSLIGERVRPRPTRGVPADVAWHAYACSQCGFCIDECDQFYGRGWESQSPRGKWYWLRKYMEGKVKWDQKWVDTFIGCTTCELCNKRCSEGLPIEQSWMKIRGKMIDEDKKMTFPPFEMMSAALSAEGNIWAGYRKDRSSWFPEQLLEKHGPGHRADIVYFAGCTASYVETDIGIATAHLLDRAGVDFTYLGEKENCCATPMLVAGKWELFKQTMRKNIEAVKQCGANTVVCSCPACDMMWRQVYPQWSKRLGLEYDLNVRHYSEVVTERIRDGSFTFPPNTREKMKVTWHDSCHLGRVSKIYEPPRELITSIPNVELVEMEHNREDARCCGSVLTLIREPAVAARIGKDKLDEAADCGAEKIVAMCPCCQFQLRVSAEKCNARMEVVDLAHFAADALGVTLPDPHPEVRAQWAVFEAMISLMTPEGFAKLMSTMWPELISAMPLGMGQMMRIMAKVPGALSMMKPMFPVLFPVLLPMMMPKVMPTMLSRVKERVPMPDYMAEQMPQLMPKVMGALMPHMIGEVVPLVTQPMIDHLKGASRFDA
jgi:Fe-S oxidoreductase